MLTTPTSYVDSLLEFINASKMCVLHTHGSFTNDRLLGTISRLMACGYGGGGGGSAATRHITWISMAANAWTEAYKNFSINEES